MRSVGSALSTDDVDDEVVSSTQISPSGVISFFPSAPRRAIPALLNFLTVPWPIEASAHRGDDIVLKDKAYDHCSESKTCEYPPRQGRRTYYQTNDGNQGTEQYARQSQFVASHL